MSTDNPLPEGALMGARRMPNGFRIVGGRCPANAAIAPFIEIMRRDIHGTVNSINRTERAAPILHKHGLHTQAEVHRMYPNISNPPGYSTHEDKADGVAYSWRAHRGALLPWWCEGWDTDDSEVGAWHRAAAHHGWQLIGFYHSGVERHHLNFKHEPKPRGRDRVRVPYIRARLPRS